MARRAAAAKLAKYRSMRDFQVTSEPSGAPAQRATRRGFVIQQHAARRMHYDFRLELDGVLLSWSVPRGPSLSPSERRLAVRTEDHPLDYADFEGVIPTGEYGAGTVSIWDRGTWEPEGDAREAMRRGRLTFRLYGHKLHGRWHLVRTKPQGNHESWLLFKGTDEATRGDVASLVQQLPLGFPLTNLDKVLYPEQGITKAQLIAYFAVVADWMLPHVANRPLTLVRCPEGRHKPCFFQKKILPGSPASIGTVAIDEEDGEVVDYMTVNDMAGLVGLAQLGTLEVHTWGCHADQVERPDFLVLDLDPDDSVRWERVALGAFELRRRLNELDLESFVKTTGGKGLHVCVPIKRTLSWGDFKAFAKTIADAMATDEPMLYTTNMAKAARKGKIFVDYLRNGRNATFIAPYSPRARPGAPVALPITWEELARGVDPTTFTTQTVPSRLASLTRDPWQGIADVARSITASTWRALGGKP